MSATVPGVMKKNRKEGPPPSGSDPVGLSQDRRAARNGSSLARGDVFELDQASIHLQRLVEQAAGFPACQDSAPVAVLRSIPAAFTGVQIYHPAQGEDPVSVGGVNFLKLRAWRGDSRLDGWHSLRFLLLCAAGTASTVCGLFLFTLAGHTRRIFLQASAKIALDTGFVKRENFTQVERVELR